MGRKELTNGQLADLLEQIFVEAGIRFNKRMDLQGVLKERTPDRRDARVFAKARIKAWLRECVEESANNTVEGHEQVSQASETEERSQDDRLLSDTRT